jgi:uncharacterized repeat protein (TIGR02543 family)
VKLEAVANEGYNFTNWSGDLSGSSKTATLVVDGDKSVTARFVKAYSLTVTGKNGSVTKDPDQASYEHGAKVILTAVADPNYRFEGWTGDHSGPDETATLSMDANKSVTARFTLKTYGLEIRDVVGGFVTKNPDQTSYEHGEKVILTAVAHPGYVFQSWSGAPPDSTNPTTLVMDEDYTSGANFALKTYSLTVTVKMVDPNDTAADCYVTKDPDKPLYNHGETVTLKAVPENRRFKKWSGDLSGSRKTATLVMDADKDVDASFGCSLSPSHRGSLGEFILPYLLLLGAWIVIKRRDASRRNALSKHDEPSLSDTQEED